MSSQVSFSSVAKHHQTQQEDRLPLRDKAGYSSGGMAYTLMGNVIGNLGNVVLNIGLGMNPVLVGLLMAIPRAIDALFDPLIGTWSDNFRSKWGRRKPFMVAGALGAGVFFIVLWWLPTGWTQLGQLSTKNHRGNSRSGTGCEIRKGSAPHDFPDSSRW